MTSSEIRLQVPAVAAYQSTLSEAAHKVTTRKGSAPEHVAVFVALIDLATAAVCTSDAASSELVIDQAPNGLQATVSGIGSTSGASSATLEAFMTRAQADAVEWHADEHACVFSFVVG